VLDASTSPPKERYAVSNDNVIHLIQPGILDDQLTEILRNGARALLAKAVEAEVADFLGKYADLKTGPRAQRLSAVSGMAMAGGDLGDDGIPRLS
jgi:putative transposase